jgi:N-acetylglucosaminyldiphosphoundecaprenol N-acetyl-beta-D-mannosaminyltransferase
MHIVTYANVQTINVASKVTWFRRFLRQEASAVFCDGFGVLLGARILGHKVERKHRMTAPDFLDRLARAAGERQLSMYLLAGRPGVVDMAAIRLKRVAPHLEVRGHHGFFEKQGVENEFVLEEINATRPDILILGFGSPLQEQWLLDNKSRLRAKVCFPVGACLDYYSGYSWRGPRWLTDHGFEWLCRLVSEPIRLGQRYLLGNPRFLLRVLVQRLQRPREAVLGQ